MVLATGARLHEHNEPPVAHVVASPIWLGQAVTEWRSLIAEDRELSGDGNQSPRGNRTARAVPLHYQFFKKRNIHALDNLYRPVAALGFGHGHFNHDGWIYPFAAADCDRGCADSNHSGATRYLAT
jgi:hypothetical protein